MGMGNYDDINLVHNFILTKAYHFYLFDISLDTKSKAITPKKQSPRQI